MQNKILNLVTNEKFSNFIILIIIINAVILGIDTIELSEQNRFLLSIADGACLVIFCIEIVLKLIAFRLNFFKNGWNIFDFTIVAISLIPNSGALSVFRALRIIRVLRLLSIIPKMKLIASALINSFSGMVGVGVLLLIFFYIYAVLTTTLFSADFPEYFGDLGKSFYTLFQIMTLESWSHGIVRPILKLYPYAWIIFVSFILIVSFIVLNMAIGIVVDSISEAQKADTGEMEKDIKTNQNELQKIQVTLEQIQKSLEDLKTQKN